MRANEMSENKCPMCPVDIRNLSAVSHNLLMRIKRNDFSASLSRKFEDLKSAILTINDHTHPDVQNFISVMVKVSKCKRRSDLYNFEEEIDKAHSPIRKLCEFHFKNCIQGKVF
jgi:hypothetical protein